MTKFQMMVMVRTVKIRMAQGRELEDILNDWPNLTEEDKQQIREAVQPIEPEPDPEPQPEIPVA